jgi:hypothetical protein
MAKLVTVYWRDIPAQVIAKQGRDSAKVQLPERFQKAIDRAAMRAGRGQSHDYLADWRRETMSCGDDLRQEAQAAAQRLDSSYPDERLQALIRAHGRDQQEQA